MFLQVFLFFFTKEKTRDSGKQKKEIYWLQMKLSLIIPSLGRETLSNVLQAIQTSQDFETIHPEVIVVFDGKDNSAAFTAFQTFVSFFYTDHQVFSGGARNVGMKKATGDIFVFLGDDTIPHKDWLKRILIFHSEHSEKNIAFLGKVLWMPPLDQDPLHQWLLNHGQFAFQSIEKNGPTWRHFYTSNISVKKELVGSDEFSQQFSGWGFEDAEFGYRLAHKGMKIVYDAQSEVFHDHPQSFEKFLDHTRKARENACIFESLHPEVRLLPRGKKRLLLQISIFFFWFPSLFSQKLRWWRAWKKVWMGAEEL